MTALEVDPEEIEERVLFADELGNDVRAARRGVAAEAQAVDESPHRARDEGGEDSIDPLRVVLELSKSRTGTEQGQKRRSPSAGQGAPPNRRRRR